MQRYAKNKEWWRETINWYIIAAENLTVETSCMIFSMLFERVSSFILKTHTFERQISAGMDNLLRDRTSEGYRGFVTSLTSAFQGSIPEWTPERTNAVIGMIKEWNASPSYLKKIDVAHEKIGLVSPPPQVLKRRNDLMHRGGLDAGFDEALQLTAGLHKAIAALLLSLLDYRGAFFSLGHGRIEMADLSRNRPEKDGLTPRPAAK